MDFKRFLKHSFSFTSSVKKFFPPEDMEEITKKISQSEELHDAEIVFAVESSLPGGLALRGFPARERALEVFSQLRVWDTEKNNGVLVYLLLADHDIEIVADRGVNQLAGKEYWEMVCKNMEESFREGKFAHGVISGIEKITELLEKHYPKTSGNPNEIPNKPVIL